jgi:biotin transport system ATP-binding protein
VVELLAVHGLSHRFRDGALGLSDLSFSVRQGDFLLIAGRNGSGKSLLVKHFIGLCQASSGGVTYRGRDIWKDIAAVRCAVGMVFQDSDSQIIGQTIDEDVSFGPENLRLPRQEIAKRRDEALERVSLSGMGQRRPDSLSGGERRRLSIAGTLAMEAECLILDEPFANLDFESIRLVLKTVTELHAQGTTIVLVTHELEKVLAHATRLAIMDSGAIVYDGAPDGLDPADFERHGLSNPYRNQSLRSDLSWIS